MIAQRLSKHIWFITSIYNFVPLFWKVFFIWKIKKSWLVRRVINFVAIRKFFGSFHIYPRAVAFFSLCSGGSQRQTSIYLDVRRQIIQITWVLFTSSPRKIFITTAEVVSIFKHIINIQCVKISGRIIEMSISTKWDKNY